MNTLQKKRLWMLSLIALGVSLALFFIFYALKQNLNIFVTPSELFSLKSDNPELTYRLGGMVKQNSIHRNKSDMNIQFVVTDYKQNITVQYQGMLPDLFREGKGVIVEGKLGTNHLFIATTVLAKHDENYMPKKVYQAMREKNHV